MYYFQSTFLLLILLCILVPSTYSDADIREKGSTGNNFTVNAVKSPDLSHNNTQKATSVIFKSNRNMSSSLMQVVAEGGIVSSTTGTHSGRENVLENPATKTVTNKSTGVNNLTSKNSNDIKPVHESVISVLDVAPQQDDEKPSVPKKGVNFHDLDTQPKHYSNIVTNEIKSNISNSTIISNNISKKITNMTPNHTSSTNATVKHKKPLETESDSDFLDISKSKEEAPKENIISIDQIDPLLVDKKSKRSDYIVPIVAVILSVPLVAILTSILYKRGTDWWQHRNYKRMDFLIEGMYHN